MVLMDHQPRLGEVSRAAARLFVCSLLKCRGPHVRWIHRKAMRSITSVMPAMKDITAQAMNAISAITGPLEGAIGPTGSATQRPFAGRPRPTKARPLDHTPIPEAGRHPSEPTHTPIPYGDAGGEK